MEMAMQERTMRVTRGEAVVVVFVVVGDTIGLASFNARERIPGYNMKLEYGNYQIVISYRHEPGTV